MGFTTLQNTPITINLIDQGNSRGWSINGTDAIHENCNSGAIELLNYPITSGLEYQYSYQIKSINNGYVQPSIGGVQATARTTTGFFTETATAINTSNLQFFSNANATISLVNIQLVTNVFDNKSTNTIVWSELNNRWSDWRGYEPDIGFSLFANLFTHKGGRMYQHAITNGRNNFYGVQYQSILKFVGNSGQGQTKTFQSLSYEANRLLITTTDGITTSLGQLSELIQDDFLKDVLNDGANQVNIYSLEGIYSASFMRDKNIDIINGDVLKGTYITIELTTVSTGVLTLRNVLVNSIPSKIGSR